MDQRGAIRLLDELTVGQIAAGEVVERPVSVVKELVENSLDAGATRIVVTVRQGGLESIEVGDDGQGVGRLDLQLTLARHATSKLAAPGDLERIATLGFRGEGLASIAAVARVRFISRVPGEEIGFAVDAHGAEIGQPEPLAAPPGTRVVVRDLFANVPVRREYLRSPSVEFARISTFLATLALGYPQVTFSLAHDGRALWVFPGSPSIEQRLAHVFGPQPARELVALDEPEGHAPPSVRGFVSQPGADRADRRMQLLFVNGRLLRSTQLAGAWSAGYATYALAHRQPYGVLFLGLASDHVDPNVHPTKSDVRLRHPEAVHDAVRRAIAGTLARNAAGRFAAALSFAPPGVVRAESLEAFATPQPFAAELLPEAVGNGASPSASPELRILAQLDDTYILATDGRALVLLDQHAAHERVAFEAISERARAGAPLREALLVPYTIELDAEAAARFEASRAALAEAGLEAEPFGERAFRITATPAGYGARAFDVRAYLEDVDDETPSLDARERVWASLACHSVVRAGEALEPAEMSALVARLARCRNPMHCPHGRPTIVRIEADAVARMFKRT
ncbi:MAG: DNA mismatch repair endonuclease MutL [Vulcanimicrobiaceae bacterium]